MNLWTLGGRLISNVSGVLIDCETCPCGESPCVDFNFTSLWTNGPFNTGVDASRARLANTSCTTDSHWDFNGSDAVVPQAEYDAGNPGNFYTRIGVYFPLTDAEFLSINCNCGSSGEAGEVEYEYEHVFDIPATLNHATLVLYGQWSVDDAGVDILVNGVSSGQTCSNGGSSMTDFVLSSGFQAGSNTLTFRIMNTSDEYPGNNNIQNTVFAAKFTCYNADLL